MKNFHLPLSDDIYFGLRAEALRVRRPATAIAREAIEGWLKDRRRAARATEIAAFAREYAGTPLDLDPELENAGIVHLLQQNDSPAK